MFGLRAPILNPNLLKIYIALKIVISKIMDIELFLCALEEIKFSKVRGHMNNVTKTK